jgi:hypothetical protein
MHVARKFDFVVSGASPPQLHFVFQYNVTTLRYESARINIYFVYHQGLQTGLEFLIDTLDQNHQMLPN